MIGKKLAGHFVAQKDRLILRERYAIRIDSKHVEVLTNQPGAKAMERADLGAVDQCDLPCQARVVAVFFLPRMQRNTDARAHFIGGSIREGYDEQLIDIASMPRRRVADKVRAALREHGGLARSGR